MDHLDDIKYAKDQFVDVAPDQLGDWTFQRNPDGTYEAGGSCPTCLGTAYGPRLAEIDEPTKELPTEVVDVVCECHCGIDHGGGPDAGCGRWWIASNRGVTP